MSAAHICPLCGEPYARHTGGSRGPNGEWACRYDGALPDDDDFDALDDYEPEPQVIYLDPDATERLAVAVTLAAADATGMFVTIQDGALKYRQGIRESWSPPMGALYDAAPATLAERVVGRLHGEGVE